LKDLEQNSSKLNASKMEVEKMRSCVVERLKAKELGITD